jgi:phospholipase C
MFRTSLAGFAFASVAVLTIFAGCRGATDGSATPPVGPLVNRASADKSPIHQAQPIDKIKHIVVVIQENRSFNDLFYGFPGAKTVTYGLDSKNEKITLQPIKLATSWDLEHNSEGFIAACNGTGKIAGTDCRMNGFNNETWTCGSGGGPKCPIKYPPYSYVPHSETAPYFSMAQQYVLADEMYASNFDSSSFVSHLYAIGGQGNSTTNYPTINWGCPGVDLKNEKANTDWVPTILEKPPREPGKQVEPCWDSKTLADELDAKKLPWAFYAAPLGELGAGGKGCGSGSPLANPDYTETGIWSTYQAIKHICYGPDWDNDVFAGPPQFLRDIANGKLRDVTWITPYCKDSDHPGCNSDTGPSWVTSVVNAIGESSFWDSTAIFVFWDDYGGLYDPEPPKYLDYDGLGGRIPMMIISPYAKKGHVSHVHYEHGSILKFIEERFGLSPMTGPNGSDRRATSPEGDCFDFSQTPRKFVPIKSKYDLNYFLHEAPDYRPPDTD